MPRSYSPQTTASIVLTGTATYRKIEAMICRNQREAANTISQEDKDKRGFEQISRKYKVGLEVDRAEKIRMAARFTVPSNTHPAPALRDPSASYSHAACDIPPPCPYPACSPSYTDFAIL